MENSISRFFASRRGFRSGHGSPVAGNPGLKSLRSHAKGPLNHDRILNRFINPDATIGWLPDQDAIRSTTQSAVPSFFLARTIPTSRGSR